MKRKENIPPASDSTFKDCLKTVDDQRKQYKKWATNKWVEGVFADVLLADDSEQLSEVQDRLQEKLKEVKSVQQTNNLFITRFQGSHNLDQDKESAQRYGKSLVLIEAILKFSFVVSECLTKPEREDLAQFLQSYKAQMESIMDLYVPIAGKLDRHNIDKHLYSEGVSDLPQTLEGLLSSIATLHGSARKAVNALSNCLQKIPSLKPLEGCWSDQADQMEELLFSVGSDIGYVTRVQEELGGENKRARFD